MESKAAIVALNALAHETRLAIYRMLVREGPAGLAAGSIGEALKLAPATLSFHLRELAHAGLVCARQQSRFVYYSADFITMDKLLAYLAEACCRAGVPAVESTVAAQRAPSDPRRIASPAAKPVIHPKWIRDDPHLNFAISLHEPAVTDD